jgi:hypothetical protein
MSDYGYKYENERPHLFTEQGQLLLAITYLTHIMFSLILCLTVTGLIGVCAESAYGKDLGRFEGLEWAGELKAKSSVMERSRSELIVVTDASHHVQRFGQIIRGIVGHCEEFSLCGETIAWKDRDSFGGKIQDSSFPAYEVCRLLPPSRHVSIFTTLLAGAFFQRIKIVWIEIFFTDSTERPVGRWSNLDVERWRWPVILHREANLKLKRGSDLKVSDLWHAKYSNPGPLTGNQGVVGGPSVLLGSSPLEQCECSNNDQQNDSKSLYDSIKPLPEILLFVLGCTLVWCSFGWGEGIYSYPDYGWYRLTLATVFLILGSVFCSIATIGIALWSVHS